jgi:hypothetical protein
VDRAAIAVTGIALALAALQVFIRDVEHVLLPVLMIGMYVTPILYPLALVPEGLRPWVAANPFGWLVAAPARGAARRDLAPRWSDAVALAVALALYFAGRWCSGGCRRTSRTFCSLATDDDDIAAYDRYVGKDLCEGRHRAAAACASSSICWPGAARRTCLRALDGVGFELTRGESLGVIGENGPASRRS